jgi:hemerythrin
MSLDWHEDLATGIEGIDTQHREIFARFALFSGACSDGKGGDELLNLIAFLTDYTAKHFHDEEQAMASAAYPELPAQQKAHADFLADFSRLKRLVEQQGASQEQVLAEKRTMVRWLVNHINHMDKAFAGYCATLLLQPSVGHPS